MDFRFGPLNFSNKRELTEIDYKIVTKHLMDGWSFYSVYRKINISAKTLCRLNRSDQKLIDIRMKYDQGKYRMYGARKAEGETR